MTIKDIKQKIEYAKQNNFRIAYLNKKLSSIPSAKVNENDKVMYLDYVVYRKHLIIVLNRF